LASILPRLKKHLPLSNMDSPRRIETSSNPKAALEQTLGLLRARDDTSRFVGLSLLRSLLDSNEELRSDAAVITTCWNAIPNKFLNRLLNPKSTKTSNVEETKSLVQLAILVVHLFANLLSQDEIGKGKMTDLCDPLLRIVPRTDPESQSLVFQTLQCITNSRAGAVALISAESWQVLVETAKEKPEYYLNQLSRLFGISLRNDTMTDTNLAKWYGMLGTLIDELQEKDPASLLETLAALTIEMPVGSVITSPL
jgi:hypothetical protein